MVSKSGIRYRLPGARFHFVVALVVVHDYRALDDNTPIPCPFASRARLIG